LPHRIHHRATGRGNPGPTMQRTSHVLRSVTRPAEDPFERWQGSMRNKLARTAWHVVCALLFRPSPRPLHAWRAFLLRCFGAKLGPGCHIYPGARIWAPWNLVCAEGAAIADEAIIYNTAC